MNEEISTFEYEGIPIKLKAKLIESGVKFPNSDDKDWTRHNNFKVFVVFNGKRTSFDFYESHSDYQLGKDTMSFKDCLFAFRSFVEDGRSSLDGFSDFCSNFGYDEDSRKAERIFKECEKSMKKLERLGINEEMATEIIDKLSEVGIE